MATYAIGDIQGCYDILNRLLTHINFDPNKDRLWLTGDIINRGPQSLKTIEFLFSIQKSVEMVLGNHDLAFIAAYFGAISPKPQDTFIEILESQDADKYIEWLKNQALLIQNSEYILVHAGIPPIWSVKQAKIEAVKVEKVLKSNKLAEFCYTMFGDKPNIWSDDLIGNERVRFAINAFTRMRYWNTLDNSLDFNFKGAPKDAPKNLIPWFSAHADHSRKETILFGHWASLKGKVNSSKVIALDTGAVWGRNLTAFELITKKIFSVDAVQN